MAAVLVVLLVVAVLAGAVVAVNVVGRRRSEVTSASPPADVVSGLMAELRKAQAETAYWRSAAERLQREADGR